MGILYSEASYFDGYHFAHIAAYEEHNRVRRKKAFALLLISKGY